MAKSLAEQLALLPEDEREAVLADLDPEALQWDSKFWLRPEQQPPDSDWSIFLALAGRGWGKALASDTPIPGPAGWKDMAALEVGDLVFDENGQPATVLGVFDQPGTERLYRVTFSDGASLLADEQHQWVTWDFGAVRSYTDGRRRTAPIREHNGFAADWHSWRATRNGAPTKSGPKVRTTKEILESLDFPYQGGRKLNHYVPLCKPLEYQEAALPIDPYVYGVWLGDGYSRGDGVCAGKGDAPELFSRLEARGYETRRRGPREDGLISAYLPRLRAELLEAGLTGKKFVDRRFLEGSVKQRRDLLAGLLDTDGSASGGYVTFVSSSAAITDAVVELARSLGEKPVRRRQENSGLGAFVTTWRPVGPSFTLSRKAMAARPPDAHMFRGHSRSIVSVEPVPVVPTRCITVDSKSSLFLAGEGMVPTHNTRASAEWLREKARITNQGQLRMAITARTAADSRDVVVEGESGLLAVSPPSERPEYFPSKRKLVWPNGNTALLFTSEEPSTLRGPQFHYSVADEFAAWRAMPDEVGMTAWANLRIATRLGRNPQIFVATTPKRVQSLKDLLEEAKGNPKIVIRKGSTMDNASNLAEAYIEGITGVYAGTKLGRQELYGEMLDDIEGALFSMDVIDQFRANMIPVGTPLKVVGVDPTVAEKPGDECGIVVMASTADRDLYRRQSWVLEDASIHGAPDVWARRVVDTARKWGAPVVCERNQGDALVKNAIQAIDPTVPVFPVWSKQGKALRAEPIALVYEQGRVHHLGYFAELEDQMTTWEPEAARKTKSPDRLDALVLAATALMVTPPKGFGGGVLSATSVARRKLPPTRAAGRPGTGRRAAVYGAGLKRR